jgi:AraC-like DNA-binding protein
MGQHSPIPSSEAVAPADRRLTQVGLVRMELFPPPPSVAPLVTTFFRLSCDEPTIRDVQPSSIGILAVMARGGGHLRFLDGRVEPSHPLSVITPTGAASTFEVAGPWDVFGAMLSPVGWASLTGLNAARHGNRLYDGRAVLPPPLKLAGELLLRDFDRLDSAAMCATLAEAMGLSARPLPARHLAFVRTVAEWLAESLSPHLGDLLDRTDYSSRQAQRLAEQYFGLPPRSLARKYRALRAAVLLSRPDISADEVAAIQDHFYDQPHMIREIRLFAGRTPARIADPDTPYLSAFLDLRDFREAGPRMAPIPDDLRA